MFTHLITLKKSPWFVYSRTQEDALNICKKYGDNVVGVVLAPEGLIMQEVQQTLSLVTPDVKFLEEIVESENRQIAKEILGEENDEILDDVKKLV
jgi:hypothetical protein